MKTTITIYLIGVAFALVFSQGVFNYTGWTINLFIAILMGIGMELIEIKKSIKNIDIITK